MVDIVHPRPECILEMGRVASEKDAERDKSLIFQFENVVIKALDAFEDKLNSKSKWWSGFILQLIGSGVTIVLFIITISALGKGVHFG